MFDGEIVLLNQIVKFDDKNRIRFPNKMKLKKGEELSFLRDVRTSIIEICKLENLIKDLKSEMFLHGLCYRKEAEVELQRLFISYLTTVKATTDNRVIIPKELIGYFPNREAHLVGFGNKVLVFSNEEDYEKHVLSLSNTNLKK